MHNAIAIIIFHAHFLLKEENQIMELKPELAQSIVDHMMTQIPYNINMMNKDGYIIASGNKDRINTLHVGAIDAIHQKRTLPMRKEYGDHGQPGVNMPITFDNEIIGVVSITGEPAKVIPLASLLRTAVELLLRQSQENKRKQEQENNWQRFIYRWLNISRYQSPETDEALVSEAKKLKVNLTDHRQVFAVTITPTKLQKIKLDPTIITFSFTNSIGLIIVKDKIVSKRVENYLKNKNIPYGVSLIDTMLGQLADQAVTTLKLRNMFGNSTFRYYKQLVFIDKILKSNIDIKSTVMRFQDLSTKPGGKDLIETIRQFISCNMNINQSAQKLFTHRNTVTNRLQRIENYFGLNPKKATDLFQLYVGYIFFYQQNQ